RRFGRWPGRRRDADRGSGRPAVPRAAGALHAGAGRCRPRPGARDPARAATGSVARLRGGRAQGDAARGRRRPAGRGRGMTEARLYRTAEVEGSGVAVVDRGDGFVAFTVATPDELLVARVPVAEAVFLALAILGAYPASAVAQAEYLARVRATLLEN